MDGSSAQLKEANGTWTGEASLNGDAGSWTGWDVELAFANGMAVTGNYSLDGDKLVAELKTMTGDKVVGTDKQELQRAENSTCQEKLAQVAVPPNAF